MIRLFFFLLTALTVLPLRAQIRGNSIVVTVEPDHQDWNYQVGETAKLLAQPPRSIAYLSGIPSISITLAFKCRS